MQTAMAVTGLGKYSDVVDLYNQDARIQRSVANVDTCNPFNH